ncbi:MAG: HAD family hydrolase [Alkalispirochaetaceae bacterium]
MRSFDAVVFDIDGTLYDNWRMYLRSIPFGLAHPRLIAAFSRVRRRIRTVRPINDFYALQSEMLSEELGVTAEEARELVDREIYHNWESKLAGLPINKGVWELLHFLKGESDLKCGVLSDFPIDRKLSLLGLDHGWDAALSSERVGYLKPNPEPFEAVASAIGVRPEAVLYVGNSYRYDVLGSKEVGMLCAHYTSRPAPSSAADLSFSSFQQLHRWIVQQQEYT